MSDNQIKDVVEATEKSFQEATNKKQEECIKKIVQDILEKIENLKEEIKELSDKKKALETDLEFLKKGRLDLVKEHQEKSKKIAVEDKTYPQIQIVPIYVERIVEKPYYPYKPWSEPWTVVYGSNTFTTSGQEFKQNVIGTYCVGTKNISIF